MDEFCKWGTIIQGVDEGDGWVRTQLLKGVDVKRADEERLVGEELHMKHAEARAAFERTERAAERLSEAYASSGRAASEQNGKLEAVTGAYPVSSPVLRVPAGDDSVELLQRQLASEEQKSLEAKAEIAGLRQRLAAANEAVSQKDATAASLRSRLEAERSSSQKQALAWGEEWDELNRQLEGPGFRGGASPLYERGSLVTHGLGASRPARAQSVGGASFPSGPSRNTDQGAHCTHGRPRGEDQA
jgi:hypothetical protein